MIRSDQICKLEKPFGIILLSTQFHTLDEKKGIHELCEGLNVEFFVHPLAIFDLLYYLDSQKAINGEQVPYLYILNLHHSRYF
jgi:hypothetical protein